MLLLELGDPRSSLVPGLHHPAKVGLSFLVLTVCQGRFRHDGSGLGLLNHVHLKKKLFFRDVKLLARLDQPLVYLRQALLDPHLRRI